MNASSPAAGIPRAIGFEWRRPKHFGELTVRMIAAILVAVAAVGGTALAQGSPPPPRLAATVVKLDADRLDLTDETGRTVSLKLPDGVRIMGIATADPADIQPGSYVGSAAVRLPDGTLQALEVHVFPPSLRGAGEGHRSMGSNPGASMTNGTVGDLAVTKGRTMTLKYGDGGTQTIVVPPDVPVVRMARSGRTPYGLLHKG